MKRAGNLLLCSLCSAMLLQPLLAQETNDILGYWEGGFVRESAIMPFSLDIYNQDGELRIVFTRPEYAPFRVRNPQHIGTKLTFETWYGRADLDVDPVGDLRGVLVKDETLPTTIHLRKVLKPALPKIELQDITFANGEVTLAGTLVLPEGSQLVPGYVFVQGRGYGSRRQFLAHAIEFARRGIASLVFDGRGRGKSGGDPKTMTAEDRYDDALAALNFLADQPRVDKDRLGMFGHSAGGWIVPMVAQRSQIPKWLILQVGPAERQALQQAHVVQAIMKRSEKGFTEEELQAAFEHQKALVEMSEAGTAWEIISNRVEAAKGTRWAEYSDMPESYENGELDYFRRQPYNSEAALASLKIPILAFYGAEDFVVPPEHNVPRLKELMAEAGNTNFKIVVFPNIGHAMETTSGMYGLAESWPNRYFQWSRRPPDYFNIIFDWVLPLSGVKN